MVVDSQYGTNVNAQGSQFTVQLSPPLQVPASAVGCSVEAVQASCWYTFPNLGESTLEWDIDSDASGSVSYSSTMDAGLYEVDTIVSTMNELAEAEGIHYSSDLWTYKSNSATQKVALGAYISASGNTVTLDLTDSSMGYMLGYDSSSYVFGSTTTDVSGSYYYIEAGNTANFGELSYLQIKSDLPVQSYGPDGEPSTTLITLTPDVEPSKQIVAIPQHPLRADADGLIGASVSNISFSLTDDDGNLVDTGGESWSTRLRFKYWQFVDRPN